MVNPEVHLVQAGLEHAECGTGGTSVTDVLFLGSRDRQPKGIADLRNWVTGWYDDLALRLAADSTDAELPDDL